MDHLLKVENGTQNFDCFFFATFLEQPSGENALVARCVLLMAAYLGDSGRPNNNTMTTIAKISCTAMGNLHAMAPPA